MTPDLDARIAADCERSGVPFHVEDEKTLGLVAALLAEALAGEGGDVLAKPA